jgi:bacterioferritin-associated ferredoxin
MAREFQHQIELSGREVMALEMSLDDAGSIRAVKLTGIGGDSFLKHLTGFRVQLKGKLSDVQLPMGNSTPELMFRELILRARGEWSFPFCEAELCHCRAVPLKVVDAAILSGAHTTREVSRDTSASTACGTCRPDVEAILKYRLRT